MNQNNSIEKRLWDAADELRANSTLEPDHSLQHLTRMNCHIASNPTAQGNG